MTVQTKKLIEVALPLPEINDASAYDKMPGIGPHPKGIHQWWARLPLPTARAVLFSSIVDDPSSHPDKFPTEEAQSAERERLFGIVRDLMQKKLHEKPEVYARARAEMLAHSGGELPEVLDPFSGGGSIPLEAARLGFVAHAADLNPVAVLLNKCNLELVPRRLGQKPINPKMRNDVLKSQISKSGAWGLAEDVRYYGDVIRKRAIEKIGHLYPKATLPKEYGGREASVIAWIWARTVASPNPAAHGAHVPLISSYWLSTKKGKRAWLEPIIDRQNNTWRFEVKTEESTDGKVVSSPKKLGGSNSECLLTKVPLDTAYIKAEGQAGRMKVRLIAVVAEIPRGRVYLAPTPEHAQITNTASPAWEPHGNIPTKLTGGTCVPYGLTEWKDIFTLRQTTALTTFSDLIRDISKDILQDAQSASLSDAEAERYAITVTTFLALSLDRCADFNNSLCRWASSNQKVMNLFGRQAIPMVWDFAEANTLGESVGAWQTCMGYVADCIEAIGGTPVTVGDASQIDAAGTWNNVHDILVSTDPPYYDNIGYAALSDFFYVWLRRTIGDLYPDLFNTIVVPKAPELTAIADERFGGDKIKAKEHFEAGFRKAFTTLRAKMDAQFPISIYYAFKQSDERESGNDEGSSENTSDSVDLTTGWETLLEALLGSGFQITATWPVRASQKWRMVSMGTNALASYIVLACRVRSDTAPQCTRRDFLTALKKELPPALDALQQGNIAPVDLAQAAIGPGMAVFSRYAKVVESSGKPMTVRTALALINQTLGEVQAEQEAEYDADTRWALAWFEQHSFEEGEFGEAETWSRAKNTAINGLVEAGIVTAGGGKVRLLKREELSEDWNPVTDKRPTVWEATQHLIRELDQHGETGAAILLRKMSGSLGEMARELAYRLHKICESNGWSAEAQAYNGLVLVWPELTKQAQNVSSPQQLELKI